MVRYAIRRGSCGFQGIGRRVVELRNARAAKHGLPLRNPQEGEAKRVKTENGKEINSTLKRDDGAGSHQDVGATAKAENEPADGITFADMPQISANVGLRMPTPRQADAQAVDSIFNDAAPLDLLSCWW